jgi:hypothetical protein
MRGIRFNGWRRIGIILSIVWVLVGTWWAQQAVFAPVRAGYSKCISLGVAPNICKAGMDAGVARRKKEELPGAIAAFAIAPIALAWLIIWIALWVRARLPVGGVEGASPEQVQGRGRMDWISGAYNWKRRAVLFAGLAAACYALGWYPASVGFCVGVVCGIWMERGVEKSETKEVAKEPTLSA